MTRQSEFRAGLLDPAHPVPKGLLDGTNNPAGKRYAVYRNNVTVSLVEAMKAAFPLIRKLIGETNFDHVAGVFVRAFPPRSPLMMFYGIEFPKFLQSFGPLSHLGYLPDAARLDLELRQSYHAADAPPFDPSVFQMLAPDALLEATLTLAPATRIVESIWPLHDIWAFNQDPGAAKPRTIAQDVLVTRPAFDPLPHPLPPGAARWLAALAQGKTFGTAHDIAAGADPHFDLTTSLGFALQTHAFARLTHKDLT